MDKSPCYGCSKASICPYKETFQKLCANIDKLKINKDEVDSTPIDSYTIRVEHRYSDGPGLENNLSNLGIKPTNRHCTLNRACPMTPWWSDPIRDNGVPIGYPIDRVARDARYCDGEKIPYRPRHTMEKTNIITRNDRDLPFRVNCFSCPYRAPELNSQLEALIQSCASTFRVDYVQLVKGALVNTSTVALTTLENYTIDTERTTAQMRITSERDVIIIYYKYKNPDTSTPIEEAPTVDDLREQGHNITLSLRPIRVYESSEPVEAFYTNIAGVVGPLVPERNNHGLMQRPGDTFIVDAESLYAHVATDAFLETDNIRFDLMLRQKKGEEAPTNWKIPEHVIRAIIPNGVFSIKKTVDRMLASTNGHQYYVTQFHVEIEYFRKKVLEITPLVIPEDRFLSVNYHMREMAVTAARWSRKNDKPFIPDYFGKYTEGHVEGMGDVPDKGFSVVTLPSPGDIYRPGFNLLGYTMDITKRKKSDDGPVMIFASDEYPNGLINARIALSVDDAIDSNGLAIKGHQLMVYYTDIPSEPMPTSEETSQIPAKYAALWDLDKNFFEDNLLKAIKTQFPDYAPPVVVDELYDTIRLTGTTGPDGANAMYNMLRKFKLELDDMGFQVEIYCAPELADPDLITIVDHRDNPTNMTPILMVSKETSPGVMEDVQLYPINLDNFDERLDLGTYHYRLVIYPEDMDGVYGDTSWVDRGITLTIEPMGVDVFNYISPPNDVDDPNVVPFFSKITGLLPEDIDRVYFDYATDTLKGVGSEKYRVDHVDTHKRWSIKTNIGFKSNPGFMAETPLFTQQFMSLCRHMDTCELKGRIPKGMKMGDVYINGISLSEFEDPDKIKLTLPSADSDEFTILIFDVREDMDIDIALIAFDAEAYDPDSCPTCKNLINLSEYPWVSVTLSCMYYSKC